MVKAVFLLSYLPSKCLHLSWAENCRGYAIIPIYEIFKKHFEGFVISSKNRLFDRRYFLWKECGRSVYHRCNNFSENITEFKYFVLHSLDNIDRSSLLPCATKSNFHLHGKAEKKRKKVVFIAEKIDYRDNKRRNQKSSLKNNNLFLSFSSSIFKFHFQVIFPNFISFHFF